MSYTLFYDTLLPVVRAVILLRARTAPDWLASTGQHRRCLFCREWLLFVLLRLCHFKSSKLSNWFQCQSASNNYYMNTVGFSVSGYRMLEMHTEFVWIDLKISKLVVSIWALLQHQVSFNQLIYFFHIAILAINCTGSTWRIFLAFCHYRISCWSHRIGTEIQNPRLFCSASRRPSALRLYCNSRLEVDRGRAKCPPGHSDFASRTCAEILHQRMGSSVSRYK